MMLTGDQEDWPAEFKAKDLDVIPDPMVMRVADLFIGGKSFAITSGLNPERVWRAIDKNLDGLIAFFHLLMTRDRIPLIDYEYTFDTSNFEILDDIAVALHPPIYADLKEKAERKLQEIDLSRIPSERRLALASERVEELEAVGYNWFPDPGGQFSGGDKLLATFLLGGLIFGGYAQISGSDHVLQPTRSKLLLELTEADDASVWVTGQEVKLFSRLNAIVDVDPRLSSRDLRLPPSILPFLLRQQPRSPQELLMTAIGLREQDKDFGAYRDWYRGLREAWKMGAHNEQCEKAIVDVTKELAIRYPLGEDPHYAPAIWSREIGLKAKVGAEAGFEVGIEQEIGDGEKLKAGVKTGVDAGLEADLGKVTLPFPNLVRNWLIEGIRFRSHRKILLRMALAQRNVDNLSLGLMQLWHRA
jgi:hypothetical protein